MEIIKDIEQQSKIWFDIRSTRMSASKGAEIGNKGKGLTTYINKKVEEQYSSKEPVRFSNKHTDRGNELEPVAATMYEFKTELKTEIIGIVIVDEWVCISPDRFVEGNGLCEIKCLDDTAHFNTLTTGNIEKKYKWQMQMQMYYCQKDWCDYVCYNPNYEKSLIVKRFYPDPEMIKDIREGVEKGKKLMIYLRNKMEGNNENKHI